MKKHFLFPACMTSAGQILVASNFQKSAEAFQKALDLHPAWVWGYIKQAYDFVYLNQYNKAISNREKAENYLKMAGALSCYKWHWHLFTRRVMIKQMQTELPTDF